MVAITPLVVLLAFVSTALASCGHGLSFIHQRSLTSRGMVATPAFSYNASTGPFTWHQLNPAYYLCGNGTNQSPIDLDSMSALAPSGSVMIDIPTAHNVTFENLGTNVEVVMGGSLQAAGAMWNLTQFHFHTPSEHRVDLKHWESEMHMVFTAADGSAKVAVVGFLVEVESESSTHLLENIFSHLGEIQTPGTTTTVPKVDFGDFQSKANALDYYSYLGSLTTPPCTEGVSWFLATTPISLKAATYIKLKNVTKTNARFVQNSLGQPNILKVAAMGI